MMYKHNTKTITMPDVTVGAFSVTHQQILKNAGFTTTHCVPRLQTDKSVCVFVRNQFGLTVTANDDGAHFTVRRG